VSSTAPQLPVDIEALQALLAAARAERDAAIAERDRALSQNDRLRHLLRQLQRAQFGRRSEKLDPEQLFPMYFASRGTPEIPAQFRHPASEPLFAGLFCDGHHITNAVPARGGGEADMPRAPAPHQSDATDRYC